MRPILHAVLCGLALALLGCGRGEAPKSGQDLIDAQNKAQQQADQDERQMQQQQQQRQKRR
jgi:hypothetical protein